MAYLAIKWVKRVVQTPQRDFYSGQWVVYDKEDELAQFWTKIEAEAFVRKIGKMLDRANKGLSVLGGVK